MNKQKPSNVANVVPSLKKAKKTGKTAAQRKLDEDWQKMLASHSKPLERGAKSKTIQTAIAQPPKQKRKSRHVQYVSTVPLLTAPPGREVKKLCSLVTPGGDAAKKDSPVYTGDKMLGIGQLHKSNAVPVFKQEDAIDLARMRR